MTVDQQEVLGDLRRLVEAESPSDDPAALRRCAEVVAEIADQRLGVTVEIGDDGRVSWHHPAAASRLPPLLILGHLDTVWPVGTLARMPFVAANGQVHGPGVFDMKGGIVVMIHALALLRRRDALPAVEVLLTSDEEVGSQRSASAITAAAQRCRRVLIPEPCGPGGAIKTARKGVAFGEVVVHGRAAHAGLDPERGINAAIALGRLLPQVAALGDADAQTTVVPSLVEAGSAINVVPARARAQLDVRFLDEREVDRVREGLARLAAVGDPDGATIETRLEVNRPALPEAASAPLLPALRVAAAEVGQSLETVTVGGASDGNLAAAAGAAVLDGLGPQGDGAHADHEHITITGLQRRVRLLAALIPHVALVEVPAVSAI